MNINAIRTADSQQIIEQAFNKLENYVIKENFMGYDPYDTLNSWIPFKIIGKWPSAIATQIQKRNPINIRPLLGIKRKLTLKHTAYFFKHIHCFIKKQEKRSIFPRLTFFIIGYPPIIVKTILENVGDIIFLGLTRKSIWMLMFHQLL